MRVAEFDRYIGLIGQMLPPPDHIFDVPQIASNPTYDDVRAASQRLIELEEIARWIPDKIRYVDYLGTALSFEYNLDEASDEQDRLYNDAMLAVGAVRESWEEYQVLVAQQIGHWQSAIAVMEHDIAWQEATGQQVRARPSIARTLDRCLSLAVA